MLSTKEVFPIPLLTQDIVTFGDLLFLKIYYLNILVNSHLMNTVADPGFPIGGADLVGGRQLPRRLRFEKFVCQNERIWTHRWGARRRRPAGSATGTCR